MFEVREKPEMVERALLVRLTFNKREEEEDISLLAELRELVDTLEIGVVETTIAFSRAMFRKYLCGTGKAAEIVALAHAHECDCIVFDNELAPSQQREWEELAEICVIDREEVILDIFAKRARTKEARLQVDLARMQYALPRMARMWGHLDREGGAGASSGSGGGGGASRGMGEMQIEVDRRLARERIDRNKRELKAVRIQRATQRKDREKNQTPQGAIVGYTNAGKSTLLNKLTDSDILAKDMLFATLDTTTRSITLPDGQHLILTDTVGFVRNLPHRLIEAFKSTLEEAVLADFLIHVVDARDPQAIKFFNTTMSVLEELGSKDKPMIIALNKIDTVEEQEVIDELLAEFPDAILTSAVTGRGLDEILQRCTKILADRVTKNTYRIPQSQGQIMNLLHADAKVLSTDYEGNDIITTAIVPAAISGKLEQYLVSDEKEEA